MVCRLNQFTDLERKGMFVRTKRKSGRYYKGRIPLKMTIKYWDINEYERSIELIIKYFKGIINYVKDD